jgi:hypothetical protein
MNPPTWRPADGHLLQRLRSEAGIDELVFARRNTLSLNQLRELESGEGQSFYSAQINLNAGLKLLKKLGVENPHPASPEPIPQTDTLAIKPASAPDPVVAATDPTASETPAISSQPQRRISLWMGGLLILGLTLWLLLQDPMTAPSDNQQMGLQQSSSPQPILPAAADNSYSVSPQTSEPAAADQNLALTPVVASPSVADPVASMGNPLKAVACADQYRKISTSHTPINPIKPGNYIYIEAHKDSELCVLDSQNKLSILSLRAGMTHTVNGLAPFLLHAKDWQGLNVFFQGRPVRIEHGNDAHLVLNSLPI